MTMSAFAYPLGTRAASDWRPIWARLFSLARSCLSMLSTRQQQFLSSVAVSPRETCLIVDGRMIILWTHSRIRNVTCTAYRLLPVIARLMPSFQSLTDRHDE